MNKLFLRLCAALAMLSCSALAAAANHTVRVGGGGLGFSPASLTIQRGDTVTFTNIGGLHNVVADDGSFRCAGACALDGYGSNTSGAPSASAWSTTRTYATAGTYGYYCEAHGAPGQGMAGTIIVEGSGEPTFQIGPAISGNWYDPAQSGHGLQLEMISATQVTAFWFTFDNAGNQAWVAGVGTINGNRITVPAVRTGGGRFPPNFNPGTIVTPAWGTLTLTFTGCNAGKLDWTSSDAAFSAVGTLPLTRATQILGTTCP